MSVCLSFLLDDSYTPSTLAIRAGTGPSDLQDVRIANLEKPEGWITFDVSSEMIGNDDEGLYDEFIRGHLDCSLYLSSQQAGILLYIASDCRSKPYEWKRHTCAWITRFRPSGVHILLSSVALVL